MQLLARRRQRVQPARLIPAHVQLSDDFLVVGGREFTRNQLGKVIIIGAGKASAAMAVSIEQALRPVISAGIIITKYGHSLPLEKIKCLEAGHPVPDTNGVECTLEMLNLLDNLEEKDLVLFLVSGGASALMADIPPDLAIEDLQDAVRLLLGSGANIDEINCVRKHLSLVKGGQLAKKIFPAILVSLILSDVNGDDLSVIASGPTVPDPSTFEDALEILNRYNLTLNVRPAIIGRLKAGAVGLVEETPKAGDPAFKRTSNFLIGTNKVSLDAALKVATGFGYHSKIINSALEGEAEEQAAIFVDACMLYKGPRPACLLMGGETTVTIRGQGLGGRNQHFVLASLCGLIKRGIDPSDAPVILSGGTDGSDGPTDATGAVTDGAQMESLIKTGNAGQAIESVIMYLNKNDAYHFFEKYGGLIKTGPTQTNVMDLVIGIVR
ncbi:MAG: glycerate kinase [Chitinophagaceae bacterium]|nr:MAG: glycerate kinase [Chitinophagaceae bacterium]